METAPRGVVWGVDGEGTSAMWSPEGVLSRFPIGTIGLEPDVRSSAEEVTPV